jgi:phospholipid/cholesterol/gamma-HCH transport system substrate-binding protein
MEREANYAAVGAFVLLVIAMGSMFVYWYAGAREHRDFSRYEIYFDGSVSGLTRGSTVRYLGVDIGRVVELRIDPRSATRVQVIADIDSSAPISGSTVAELSLQGVTGLLYIDLLGTAGSKRLSDTPPSERYPVIPSVRSNFDLFVSSLPDVVAKAGEVAQRVSAALSDENIAALTNTVGNIDKASQALPAIMRDVDRLVADLRGTAAEVTAVANRLRAATDDAGPNLKVAIERVRVVSENLALIADNQNDIRNFTRDALPELERLVRDGRAAAREFQVLTRSLRDNPSQLIYEPPQPGVEIPR